MRKLAVFTLFAAVTAFFMLPCANAAMVMKGKKAPDAQAAPAAAAAPAPASGTPAKPEPAATKTETPPASAETPAPKAEPASAKAETAPAQEEKKANAAAKAKPKGEGVIGSVGYTQGDRVLVDCRTELPAKILLNVYDEGYRRIGLLRVVGLKGKNMYLTSAVEGSASTGNKVAVETEEEAYRRVSSSREDWAVKEFLELYPDSAHAKEFAPKEEQAVK